MTVHLTDIAIRQLPFTEKGQKKIADRQLPGFGVIVGTSSKSFYVKFGPDRRTRTLGKWPSVTLKEARSQAKTILASPNPFSRSTRLSEARNDFLEDCALRLRKSTVDRYFYALKDISDGPLDGISTNYTDPTQLKSLKAFYNWCIDHQLTDKNPFLRRRVTFAVRERLLTDDEIAAIWAYDYPPYSDIVKLLILTGQRRKQIHEFDPDWIEEDTIVFPSSIMKGKKVHTLPITPMIEPLLADRRAFNSFSKAKVRIDKHTAVTDWVLHDLRRYFSSTMARLGVPLHITEQILDHRSTVTGVAAVYNRYQFIPEMRAALLKFEAHMDTLISAKA